MPSDSTSVKIAANDDRVARYNDALDELLVHATHDEDFDDARTHLDQMVHGWLDALAGNEAQWAALVAENKRLRKAQAEALAAVSHMWGHRYDIPTEVLDPHATDDIYGPVAVDLGKLAEARQALEATCPE